MGLLTILLHKKSTISSEVIDRYLADVRTQLAKEDLSEEERKRYEKKAKILREQQSQISVDSVQESHIGGAIAFSGSYQGSHYHIQC